MFHRAPAPQTAEDQDAEKAQAQEEQRAVAAVPAARAPYAPPYASARAQQQAVQQQQAPQIQASSEDRRLVVGRGITLSGEIGDCEYVVIEGTVEAALRGARFLEITESGTFYGSVEIAEATVAGRFEGDLIVDGLLRVLSTGAITGSVACRTLEVEAGALIDGRISPLGRGEAAAKAESPARAAKKPQGAHAPVREAAKSSPQQPAANAAENHLFTASVAVGA